VRINRRDYGRRFSIILDKSQLRELAQADPEILGEMVASALKMVKKLDNASRESGTEESADRS